MTVFLISKAYDHKPLSIRTQDSALDIMASHHTGYGLGQGANAFGSGTHGGDFCHQQIIGLNAAQGDAISRRRSMTIQDMLNPSDEEVKHSPQTTSSQFSSDEDLRPSANHSRTPVSRQSKKSPRSDTHARRSASYTSKDGSRRPSRRPTRSPSSSPEIAQKTRAFRPAYSTEEQHFIWYLRIDRGYLWPDLLDAFNARFSRNGGRRELSGLQCRYYRLLGQYGMPQVRMLRTADVVQRYGMRASLARAGYRVTYPWLGGQYPNNAYGQVLEGKITAHLCNCLTDV